MAKAPINIAEKLFLEILVLHGGRTGTNQMTSNTLKTLSIPAVVAGHE